MSHRVRAAQHWAAWTGVAAAAVLIAAAFVYPDHTALEVYARAPRSYSPHEVPPLHGTLDVTWFGPGTIPAVLMAVLGWRYAAGLAERLAWRRLLAASYAASLAWLVSLALVGGRQGISGVLTSRYEYLPTARRVGNLHHLIETYISRIPYSAAPHNWSTSVAGHPPGMLLFFVLLDRIGLGGDFAEGMAVTVAAASIAVAVLVTLRALGAEALARTAAPFLVLTPAAVFEAVSADAVIAAVVAWGLAALALSAASRGGRGRRDVGWAALAGLLLGCSVFMSYGMPLMGLVALAVLVAARAWRPLPVAVVVALGVVFGFAALGFSWWDAYPVLKQRYYDGIAHMRPYSYWWWGDLAAFLVGAGPMVAAGVLNAVPVALSRARRAAEPVLLLSGSTLVVLIAADMSKMSKAEVERIWLPFAPWLTLTLALLPERWRKWALAVQVLTALVVQHLFQTVW